MDIVLVVVVGSLIVCLFYLIRNTIGGRINQKFFEWATNSIDNYHSLVYGSWNYTKWCFLHVHLWTAETTIKYCENKYNKDRI